MSLKALKSFVAKTVEEAKEKRFVFGTLETTMMKYRINYFGAIVEVFFCKMFSKNTPLFKELNVDTRNGLGDV
jgi:isocitrate dehydrogenase